MHVFDIFCTSLCVMFFIPFCHIGVARFLDHNSPITWHWQTSYFDFSFSVLAQTIWQLLAGFRSVPLPNWEMTESTWALSLQPCAATNGKLHWLSKRMAQVSSAHTWVHGHGRDAYVKLRFHASPETLQLVFRFDNLWLASLRSHSFALAECEKSRCRAALLGPRPPFFVIEFTDAAVSQQLFVSKSQQTFEIVSPGHHSCGVDSVKSVSLQRLYVTFSLACMLGSKSAPAA